MRVMGTAAGLHFAPSLFLRQGAKAEPESHFAAFDRYSFGVSYYPEQWPTAQIPEDFAKMRDLGFNLVRMGEFAWSTMQPSPSTFHFDWLDRAVAEAAKNGIAVVLGTPTASVPPWLYKLHPDVLSGNEQGPYTYGGRKGFAVDNPAMRQATTEVISRLCARYGSNPAVVGWQLSNEPGYPMVNFDPNALAEFQRWLQQRYGSLKALNAAWSGPFWSNEYDSWDEIHFPTNSAEGGWNPGVHLDYRRFFSESFLRWLRFEAGLVKQHAHNQFIYTNWPEVAWSVDLFEAAKFLDATAWDNYGTAPGTGTPYQVLQTAFNHDLCRATRSDQRFFVAEQPTQPPADTDALSVRLCTWTDVAYGSCGTVFFEFRTPVEGSEMAYVSMLEPDGSFGASAAVLRQTFAEITRLQPKLGHARTVSDIALIYSYENSWDQGFRIRQGPGVGAGYDNVAQRYYIGVKSLKRNVDVVPDTLDLAPYRLVVAPGLRLVSEEHAAAIARWVESGGILVLDHKAGMRSPDGRLRPLIEPGVFAPIAGIHVQSTEPARGTPHTVSFSAEGPHFTVAESEAVAAGGAESLARYHGQHLEGQPAVTLHPAGRGFVVYVSFSCRDDGFFDALFAVLAQRFAIRPLLAVPQGVDVVSRTSGRNEYVFLLNDTPKPMRIALPESATELLTGRSVKDELQLDPVQLAILERPIRSSIGVAGVPQ